MEQVRQMAVSAKEVKQLRDKTGAGPLDCKKALEQFDGDMDLAAEFCAKRRSKMESSCKEGQSAMKRDWQLCPLRQSFGGHRRGQLRDRFRRGDRSLQSVCEDIAMHIANLNPQFVKREDVPADLVSGGSEGAVERALEEGKPEKIAEKIVAGRMNKWYEEIVLMEQDFIKDDDKTVSQYLQETVAEVGETIKIERFQRFAIGDGA